MEAALRRPITSAAVSPSRLLTASMSLPQQTGNHSALSLHHAASLPIHHMHTLLLCLLSMQMHLKIHPALSATPVP